MIFLVMLALCASSSSAYRPASTIRPGGLSQRVSPQTRKFSSFSAGFRDKCNNKLTPLSMNLFENGMSAGGSFGFLDILDLARYSGGMLNSDMQTLLLQQSIALRVGLGLVVVDVIPLIVDILVVKLVFQFLLGQSTKALQVSTNYIVNMQFRVMVITLY